MVSTGFSAPFFLPASRSLILAFCLPFFLKGAQLCNTTQLDHLFYSGITTDTGKHVEICVKLVKFYEVLLWYQIWRTRLVLVFEIRL